MRRLDAETRERQVTGKLANVDAYLDRKIHELEKWVEQLAADYRDLAERPPLT